MLDRTIAPAFSQKFSFELPQPQIISLPAGLELVIVPGIQQEVVKLEVIFKAGKWHEPFPGLSHFTSALIDKGTASRSAKEIAGVFDYYGAQVEISAGHDFISISLYGLNKHLPEILPVFMELLNSPSFPEDELNLQKEILKQNLRVNSEKNSFIASRLLRKNIFGDAHPYGRPTEENDAHQITSQKLSDFFKSHFHPVEIYLVGNLAPQKIEWLAQQFDPMIPQVVEERKFDAQPGLRHQQVAKAGSVQSSIRLGKRTINRLHADYFSLLMANHLLGGYFGSRLMRNIREEKGLTYGISSSIHPFLNDCMISIGADVNKSNVELAKEEIKKEINCLKETLITEEELTVAKNHFLGSLQLEIASPFAVLEKTKSIRLNKLGEMYYQDLFSKIRAIGPEAILIAARQYLEPASFVEVSVG